MLRDLWQRDRSAPSDDDFVSGEVGGRRFVTAAAHACSTPIAVLKLCSGAILVVRGSMGMTLRRIERRHSFCALTLAQGAVLEVCDAVADPRFAQLPLVSGAPFIRYYMGAPLRTPDGVNIGALSVMDTSPRAAASPDQRRYLAMLARQAAFAMAPEAARLGRSR